MDTRNLERAVELFAALMSGEEINRSAGKNTALYDAYNTGSEVSELLDVMLKKLNLKLYESIILLILRILYDEKKRELSISDEVIVNLGDIQDKYLSLQIRNKMIDKTTMRNALSVFRRFQLIEILDRDLANEESRILIYDSILMAVQIDDIKKAYEKVEIYRKGRQTDEEADENEAD